ncbi:hypothetical protein [Sandaracinus amylolyticus]|uniref:hypothetical protein n=1 Tax=Sandaracinus amylolyticus TaxID=927083 RepID=UPI0012EDE5EA|nr:hypothetical protein [Sandaracinus amylolyticus]
MERDSIVEIWVSNEDDVQRRRERLHRRLDPIGMGHLVEHIIRNWNTHRPR